MYFCCRFGRRKPLTFYFIIGGITCLSAGILSNEAGEGFTDKQMQIGITGKKRKNTKKQKYGKKEI